MKRSRPRFLKKIERTLARAVEFLAGRLFEMKSPVLSWVLVLAVPVVSLCFVGIVAAHSRSNARIEAENETLRSQISEQAEKHSASQEKLEELLDGLAGQTNPAVGAETASFAAQDAADSIVR
jgi:hypothetical protein